MCKEIIYQKKMANTKLTKTQFIPCDEWRFDFSEYPASSTNTKS